MSIDTKCIVNHINEKKEFDYIKQVSDYYKIDYMTLCNFSLDLYNYQRRCGLDKTGAKILSLNRTAEYANTLYTTNLKRGLK